MKTHKTSKGFTLIELLIVITIIGILAVSLLPSVLGAPARARDAARISDLRNITTALEVYNSDNQGYPDGTNGKGCIGSAGFTDLDKYFQGGKPPKDPQGTSAKTIGQCGAGEYLYCKQPGTGAGYYIAANMEISGDGNMKNGDVTNPSCGSSGTLPTQTASVDGDSAYIIVK